MKSPRHRASRLCGLLIFLLGSFSAQVAAADAMPVADPASLLGLLLCAMVGGGAVAVRRERP